jgi:hypothetical protein
MAISLNQQVDYLWKKLGFRVAKTDVSSVKDATNERIDSAPFLPGDKIWAQTDLIPGIIPISSTTAIQVFTTASSRLCTMDISSQLYRTWLTGLTDWIPTEYGSTYQIQVFLAPTGNANPASWTQLYATGTNNSDEWYFDYEAGVLNFIGDNLPFGQSWVNKEIRICGARYIGIKGLGVFTTASFGNITISGETISSTSNIILDPAGNINVSGSTISNVAYPVLPTDAATSQYVTDKILELHPNTLYQGDSIVQLSDPTGNAGILTVTLDGNIVASFSNTTSTLGNLTVTNTAISSTGNITFTPAVNSLLLTNSVTAFKLPTGTEGERPLSPQQGYVRFNTTVGSLEVFNGTDWAGPQSAISSQLIIGDGITNTFPLDQTTHANNILVAIHGVTQVPGDAYTVVGATIIFNAAPALNEVVEIRFISISVTPDITESVIDSNATIVGTSAVTLDTFSVGTYRSVKYSLSITTAAGEGQMAEVMLTHNGYLGKVAPTDVKLMVSNTDMTGGSTTLSYNASHSAGVIYFTATSSTAATQVKAQKTYFTV